MKLMNQSTIKDTINYDDFIEHSVYFNIKQNEIFGKRTPILADICYKLLLRLYARSYDSNDIDLFGLYSFCKDIYEV